MNKAKKRSLENIPVSLIDVVFEELVLAKSGSTDCALVREMSRFESLAMVFGHVIEKFPLEHFATHWTPSGILALIGQFLHAGSDQSVGSE